MKFILLLTSILLATFFNSFSQETIMLRSYHEKRGSDNRIEIYGPDGEYEKIGTGNWRISNDKEFQLLVSDEVDKINKRGFKLVSYNETLIDYAPYVLYITYIFSKD